MAALKRKCREADNTKFNKSSVRILQRAAVAVLLGVCALNEVSRLPVASDLSPDDQVQKRGRAGKPGKAPKQAASSVAKQAAARDSDSEVELDEQDLEVFQEFGDRVDFLSSLQLGAQATATHKEKKPRVDKCAALPIYSDRTVHFLQCRLPLQLAQPCDATARACSQFSDHTVFLLRAEARRQLLRPRPRLLAMTQT